MKKCLLRGIAVAAMTGYVLVAHAQDATTEQYPTILQQPIDQCLPIGGSATFSVVATNADSYQWYKNNVAMDGQTNSTLSLASLTINDVGYYSAAVLKGADAVPTRMADLNVYTVSTKTTSLTATITTTAKTKLLSTQLLSVQTMSALDLGGGGTITVYGAPVANSGGSGSCPGRYAGYVNFTKPMSQGWGWAPSTGTSVHTATDYNQSNTKVQYGGQYGDSGCASNSVTLGYQMSPVYRFAIYFPTNTMVPTNAYPITLDGFDP